MVKFDTTLAFINSHVRSSGYVAGEIVSSEGFTSKGDKGNGLWRSKGTIGTASQTPLANNLPELSDASGNEFALVGESVIDLNVLGGTTAAFINIANSAGLVYSQGLTSDASVDVKAIDTVNSMVNDGSLAVGDTIQTAEFSTGNGGGATYSTVLTSGVTPNTFDIIVGVSDPLISFVLRKDLGFTLNTLGAVGDGVSNDTLFINHLNNIGPFNVFGEPDKVYLTDPVTVIGSATSAIGLDLVTATLKARTASQAHVLKLENLHVAASDPVRVNYVNIKINGDGLAVVGCIIHGAQYGNYKIQARNCTSIGVHRDAEAGFGIFYNDFDILCEDNGSGAIGDAGFVSITSDSTFRIAANRVKVTSSTNKGHGLLSSFEQDNYMIAVQERNDWPWQIDNTRSIVVSGGYSESNGQGNATNGIFTWPITGASDAGGGQVTILSATHKATEGQSVVHTGTTSYNGTFVMANVVQGVSYEITATFVATETGTAAPKDTPFELLNGSTGARGVAILGGRHIGDQPIGAGIFNPGNTYQSSTNNTYSVPPHTQKGTLTIDGETTLNDRLIGPNFSTSGVSIPTTSTVTIVVGTLLGADTLHTAVLQDAGSTRADSALIRINASNVMAVASMGQTDGTLFFTTDGTDLQVQNTSGAGRTAEFNIIQML